MLLRVALVCVALCTTARAQDDALLNRVQDAFMNLRTTDGKLKSLRFDATLPFLGGAYRIRMAYAAPDRYSSVVLTEDTSCPIAIGVPEGTFMYDAARGRLLTHSGGSRVYFVLHNDFGTNVQMQWGFSLEGREGWKEDPKGLRLDLRSLLSITPLNPSVRRTKTGLVYEAYSKRGNKMLAYLRTAPRLSVRRLEFWVKGNELPFLLIDGIRIDEPLPKAAFPALRAEDWKGTLPLGTLSPKKWEDFPLEKQTQLWTGQWYALMLARGALDRGLNRRTVMPRAGEKEWEQAVARHKSLTPVVLARWKKLYGDAMPSIDRYRVADIGLDAGDRFPVVPSDEEAKLAKAIASKIRNRTADEIDRLVVETTEWYADEPAVRMRVTRNGERFGFHAVSVEGGTPIAIATESECVLYDAGGGRLLRIPDARTAVRFGLADGKIESRIGLHVSAKRPRLTLGFADVLAAFPLHRRAVPGKDGLVTLDARDPDNGLLRLICDPKKIPVVREIRLLTNDLEKVAVLLRLRDWTAADERPALRLDAFKELLPMQKLDGPREEWRLGFEGEFEEISPLYFLAIERLALRRTSLRVGFPDRSKQHWIAFEQRENELTPEVTRIWRKAFGKLR